MPLPILGGTKVADTTFSVANSCRFNLADSSYVHKTQGTSTDTDKYTLSVWLKRGSNLGAVNSWFSEGTGLTAQADYNFSANGTMMLYNRDASSNIFQLVTNRVFRDVSAWYHIVLLFDSSQATDTNRMKLYINGTQETSFSTATYPAQDLNSEVNKGGTKHTWAAFDSNGSIVNEFDGYVAEALFLDGTVAAIGDLGEFDEDSPTIWKPKDVSGLTFGTNGYYLDFEDSANLGNDANGGTDFTEVNLAATDQATDSPTNSFATWNPLIPQGLAYAEGNLSATHDASSWKSAYSTHAMSGSGKYFFETKISTLGSYQGVGVIDADQISSSAAKFGASSRGYGYKNDANKTNGDTDSSYGATYTTNDIIGCALDLTNGAIYFSKNGAWQNSATTAEIAAGTTTNAAYTGISSSYVYLPAVQIYGTGTNILNAGNPPYALTSAVNDGNGYGNFEYTPPSGFLAICTKNLGSDGG